MVHRCVSQPEDNSFRTQSHTRRHRSVQRRVLRSVRLGLDAGVGVERHVQFAVVVQSVSKAGMESAPVEIDRDLVDLLEELHRPAKQAARELIVLELYRQGEVSSGRAAQLLGKEREEFIRYASQQGIPYFQLDSDELQRELDTFKKL